MAPKIDLDPQLFEMQAEFCRMMGNRNRLMILHALREGEMCVSDLTEILGTSQPVVSQHLAVLRKIGVLVTRRDGQHVFYALSDPNISSACDMIRSILQRNVEERSAVLGGKI